jgi:hypothetical protein
MTYEEYLSWKDRLAAAEPVLTRLAVLHDFLQRSVEPGTTTGKLTVEYVAQDGTKKTIEFVQEEAIGAGHLLAERLKNDLLAELARL